MAKREENLKKINEELEKLSDEELEKVAGGARWFDSLRMIEPNKIPNNDTITGKEKIISFGK